MSTHENIGSDQAIQPGSDRSFGLVVGGILAAIGGYQWFTGSGLYLWLLLPGVALAVIGLAAPGLLHVLNVAWTRLGVLLGKIVTPLVMLLVYITTIVPIGLIMRLAGKDLLGLKRAEAGASYWIERTPHGPAPESLKDQF